MILNKADGSGQKTVCGAHVQTVQLWISFLHDIIGVGGRG